MARVTGGVEGARDAAGRSLEQERKMQGTPSSTLPPSARVPYDAHFSPHTHT